MFLEFIIPHDVFRWLYSYLFFTSECVQRNSILLGQPPKRLSLIISCFHKTMRLRQRLSVNWDKQNCTENFIKCLPARAETIVSIQCSFICKGNPKAINAFNRWLVALVITLLWMTDNWAVCISIMERWLYQVFLLILRCVSEWYFSILTYTLLTYRSHLQKNYTEVQFISSTTDNHGD